MIAILIFLIVFPIAWRAQFSTKASNGRPVPTQREIELLSKMLEENQLAIALEHQSREKGES